ncbi:hypothetical protein MMC10_008353 [Thelotrema lepadinum]|nr:hypothetical protein [Thelotrema lepadinum]
MALEAGGLIALPLWLQVLLFPLLARATDVSLTLQVPAGTSTHGDANLICTPTQWTDVLLFLLANYVAHVLTIVSRPDFDLRILKGHTTFEYDQTDETKLEEGAHELHHLPAALNSRNGHQLPTLIYRAFYSSVAFDGKSLAEVPQGYRVSSAVEQSSQYRLVHVPTEVQTHDDDKASCSSQYEVTLSAPHSFSRTAIGIFQAVYSCVMIYVARGDQLERYSWGAFGLSVTPYAMMSMLNTVANTLTPVHPALHLVDSDALIESRRRGARYGFVVGQLCVAAAGPTTWTGVIDDIIELQGLYIMKFMSSTVVADEVFRAQVKIDARAKSTYLSTNLAFKPAYRSSWLRHTWTKCLLMAIIPFVPLAIAGGMSAFRLPQETSSAMVMIWLVLGPVSGLSTALKLLFSKKEESFHDWRSTPWSILAYWGLLPIFGMAAVIVMLVDFGACVRLD